MSEPRPPKDCSMEEFGTILCSLTQLNDLNLTDLYNEKSDKLIQIIMPKLGPSLVELSFGSCKNTNAALYAIGAHCSKLERLTMKGNFTSAGVRDMVKTLKKLTYLDLRQTKKVTKQCIDELTARHPDLYIHQ